MRQLRKLKGMTGYHLNARDGDIGKLKEIYFDDQDWAVRYFVVHTGTWLSGTEVLIVPAVVLGVDEDGGSIDVDLSLEQIRGAPPVDTKRPVSRHYEQEYYRYFGIEPYWSEGAIGGPISVPPPVTSEAPKEPEHPHLRSSDEVVGYRIQARDGEIGHVEDFVIEEPGWNIRYLEVDTRNWLPGKHVLVSPTWIDGVDWSKGEVRIKLNREAIETAPAYDSSRVISRDYQVELFSHYGMTYREE